MTTRSRLKRSSGSSKRERLRRATEAEEIRQGYFKGWAKEINHSQLFPFVIMKIRGVPTYLKREKYGEGKWDYDGSSLPERCHDCGARDGMYHAFGCDWERVPNTDEQMLSTDRRIGFAHSRNGVVVVQ